MSIIHFFGKFQFQLPYQNNEVIYDARSKDKVIPDFENGDVKYYKFDKVQKSLKCDPSDYFRFRFKDCTIKTITSKRDTVPDINADILIGSKVLLNGFLADVSPRLQYGRLFPIAENGDSHGLEIANNSNKLLMRSFPVNTFDQNTSFILQSDLYNNMRTDNEELDVYRAYFRFSAYFDSMLKDIQVYDESSPFLKTLKKNPNPLYLYFNTCQFKTKKDDKNLETLPENEGNVYGYIAPYSDIFYNENILIRKRRIVVRNKIESIVKNAFNITDGDIGKKRFSGNVYPLEGLYDILTDEGKIVIRYLHFIPFVKFDNNDLNFPTDLVYKIYLVSDSSNISLIDNMRIDSDIAKRNGGIMVFDLPDQVLKDPASYFLNIDVIKDGKTYEFMKEPKVDLIMLSERGLILDSGNSSSLTFCICKDHRKINDYPYKISIIENDDSPIVGYFDGTLKVDVSNKPILDSDGHVTSIEKEENSKDFDINLIIKSMDFEDLKIYDPFEDKPIEIDKIWDRYFGNYLKIAIESTDDNLFYEKIIPVRVIRSINLSKIKPESIRYSEYVINLFEYYSRYFPLIHTRKTDEFAEIYLKTIFDFNNKEDVIGKIDKIINFLNLKDNHKNKMPRSRDFYANGSELLKLWRDSGFK